MKTKFTILVAAGLLIAAVVVLPLSAQQKKRVAVLNFDYATVQGNIQAIFGTNQDVGKGIADLLVRHAAPFPPRGEPR